MSSSNDIGKTNLLSSNPHPQISSTIGVSQDGCPLGVPGPAYIEPGFIIPGSYPSPGYFPEGKDYPQGPNSGAYPEDRHLGFPQVGLSQGNQNQQNNSTMSADFNNKMNNTVMDEEAGVRKSLDFSEKSIRRSFIRKVYGILSCQLAITIGFISLFLFHEPTKQWAGSNPYMMIIALAVYFVMAFSMICCSSVRRKSPTNLIFLGLFTVATSYMLGMVTSQFDVDTVLLAVCITAAVVVALTLFAFQTKYDFTGCSGFLLCCLVILLVMGIMCPTMPNRTTDILYASAGALVFSLYLIYDTQMMLGGNHKFAISPEEYIFAALQLYLDIINLFIRILALVARR